MTKSLRDFAKKEIKDGLNKLTESHQMIFRRMYSHKNLDAGIDEIIDNMSDDQLNISIRQIERTLEKINK